MIRNRPGNTKILDANGFSVNLADGVLSTVDLGASYTVISLMLTTSTGGVITAFDKSLRGGNPTQYIDLIIYGTSIAGAKLYVTVKI